MVIVSVDFDSLTLLPPPEWCIPHLTPSNGAGGGGAGRGGGVGALEASRDTETGQEASSAAPILEPTAEQGARVAMAGQGIRDTMAVQSAWAAMADPGIRDTMADPGIRDTMAVQSA